jgi:hypothetical protein
MPRAGSVLTHRGAGQPSGHHIGADALSPNRPQRVKRSEMVTTMNPDIDDIVRRVVARVKDELVAPEWLTPDQAATYCGLTARGLEDLRYRKAGPVASKVGGRIVRYRRADLDAWLVAGREA